jgi:hypothetical protein
MRVDGRNSGYLSFEAEAEPQNVSICHCTDCQNGSGTFSVTLRWVNLFKPRLPPCRLTAEIAQAIPRWVLAR